MFGFYTCLDGLSIPQPCTRLSGVFRSEWILGSYIFHFFPIFIILIIFSKYIKAIYKNLLIPLFFVITLFAIYITGERSSFILMIFFSIAYIFVIFFYGKYKKSIIIFSLLLIITFANLIPKNSRFTNNVFFSNYLEKETSTVDVYRSLYITAFNMFLDRPLSGHGNQMFRHKCSDQKYKFGEYYCNNHPHNYYFQILAENGIIGFFFFFIFFLYLVKIFIKSFIFFNIINHQRLTAIFLLSCSLIVSFLPFIPNGNFYTSVTGIFIFTKIGLLYGLKYSKKNSNIG
jgi:O-antigen ligase